MTYVDEIPSNLVHLLESVRALALPAEAQLELFPHQVDTSYELASNFSNWCRWALGCRRLQFTESQRLDLSSLDRYFDDLSNQKEEYFWSDDAIRADDRWEKARQHALHLSRWLQGYIGTLDLA